MVYGRILFLWIRSKKYLISCSYQSWSTSSTADPTSKAAFLSNGNYHTSEMILYLDTFTNITSILSVEKLTKYLSYDLSSMDLTIGIYCTSLLMKLFNSLFQTLLSCRLVAFLTAVQLDNSVLTVRPRSVHDWARRQTSRGYSWWFSCQLMRSNNFSFLWACPWSILATRRTSIDALLKKTSNEDHMKNLHVIGLFFPKSTYAVF